MSNPLISQVRRSLEEATGKRVVVIRVHLGEEVDGVYGARAAYLVVVEPEYVFEQLENGSGVLYVERARPGEEYTLYIVKPPTLFLSGEERRLLSFAEKLAGEGWRVTLNDGRLAVTGEEMDSDSYGEAKKRYGDALLALSRIAEEAVALGLRVEGSSGGGIEIRRVVD